jgi:hypothetical protein
VKVLRTFYIILAIAVVSAIAVHQRQQLNQDLSTVFELLAVRARAFGDSIAVAGGVRQPVGARAWGCALDLTFAVSGNLIRACFKKL